VIPERRWVKLTFVAHPTQRRRIGVWRRARVQEPPTARQR
jgi:hypothetical protein